MDREGNFSVYFFISTHTWVPRFLKIKKNIVGKAIKKVKQKREKE